METKSISRLLSLLELGGQTGLVRIYPAGGISSNGASPSVGWSQEDGSSSSSAASWYADLYMQAGQLQYSAVFSASGERRLVGEQALNFLGQMGGLSYELLPIPERPAFGPPEATAPPARYQQPGHAGYFSLPEEFDPAPSREAPWFPNRFPTPAAAWRPARTRWGELLVQNAQRLTRDQRRVLALINGQRTVDELSRLLGFSTEALLELLTYFRDQNLIS